MLKKRRLSANVVLGLLLALTACTPAATPTPPPLTAPPTVPPPLTATAEPMAMSAPTAVPTLPPTATAAPPAPSAPTETPAPTATEAPTAEPTAEVVDNRNVVELRNCTTERPDDLEAAVDMALEYASREGGGKKEIWVNGTDSFTLTPETQVIIRVVPKGSVSTYLLFSTDNRFGYYDEDGKLVIQVSGNAPRSLYSALLGFIIPKTYLVANPENPEGTQIPLEVWPSSLSESGDFPTGQIVVD